jgi:alpha-glucuronidase
LTGVRPDIVGPRDVSVRTKDEDLLLVGGPEANELVRKAAQAGKIRFKNLQPEGFLLKTIKIGERSALVIGGNDEGGNALWDLRLAGGFSAAQYTKCLESIRTFLTEGGIEIKK